jgi:hypothetical protein
MDSARQQFRPTYLKLNESLECINQVFKLPFQGVSEQMEQAISPIKHQLLEISDSIRNFSFPLSHLSKVFQVKKLWPDLIEQTTHSNFFLEGFECLTQARFEGIIALRDSIAQVQAAAKFLKGVLTHQTKVQEPILSKIDFIAMALPEPACMKFYGMNGNKKTSYDKLEVSLDNFKIGYELGTNSILEKNMELGNKFIVQAFPEVGQVSSCCIALLHNLKPALAKMYIGAYDSLRNRNVDCARHIFSSLRELWTHLLYQLAPDEDVVSWVTNDININNLICKGRPTRKARVLYIFLTISQKPLTEVANRVATDLVKYIELFNHLHKCDLQLSVEELNTILLRTNSWLMYILQISEKVKLPC